MANTRAKFKVTQITKMMGSRRVGDSYEPAELQNVTLSPVYGDDPSSENRKFWDASPSGKIELGILNKEAWKNFELDKEYYVDFTPAEEK
jgi:hypothetical protein